MKGVYILIIQVIREKEIRIKSLGEVRFEKGVWLYVGSAMGGGSTSLENRIARHFREKKKVHWHIDRLLQYPAILQAAIWAESVQPFECKIARSIEERDDCVPGPKGFGASDCKSSCASHLFRCLEGRVARFIVNTVFSEHELEPRITFDGKISS